MTKRSAFRSAALAAAILVAGCATPVDQTGNPPLVQRPSEAATLILYRDASLVGLFAAMHLKLDKREFYRLGRNQSYSLQLDPHDYLLEYTIGLNECSRVINLAPRQTLRLRLAPDCMMYED